MQGGSYSIEVDVSSKLVLLDLVGFWSEDTATAFAQDVQAAVRRIGARPNQHLVLADLSRFRLQSQAVVAICRSSILDARLPARRLAVVVGEGLARIQIKRILVRDGMEVFAGRQAAIGWLLDEDRATMRRVG